MRLYFQTPGLFHNIGKIHKQILVSFATPGDKIAKTALQGDQKQFMKKKCVFSYYIFFKIV